MTKAPKKRRKKAKDLTNEEVARRVFPTKLRRELKKIVRQLDKPQKKRDS